MPRTCTVCVHPESFAINEALVIEQRSNRAITRQYGLSKDAVRRHRAHIPQLLVKAYEAEQAAQADDLLDQLRAIQNKTLSLLLRAEGAGDLRTALAGISQARQNVELLARLAGELDTRPVINLVASAEWVELRTAILLALEPHVDARQSVVRAIEGVGNGSG